MKSCLSLLLLTCCCATYAQQQVPISQIPYTQTTPPAAMWLPGSIPGENVSRKIDVKTLPKLDSLYISNDTIWVTKAGRKISAKLPVQLAGYSTLQLDSIILAKADSLVNAIAQPQDLQTTFINGTDFNQDGDVYLHQKSWTWWYQDTNMSSTAKVGVLVNPQSGMLPVASAMHMKNVRTGVVVTSPNALYQTFSNAGLGVQISMNCDNTDGTRVFPTSGQLGAFMAAYRALLHTLKGFAIFHVAQENEEDNYGYGHPVALDYIREFSATARAVHDSMPNTTFSNGGLAGPQFYYWVYNRLNLAGRSADATTFKNIMFGASQNMTAYASANAAKIAFVDSVMYTYDTISSTYVKYVNYHFYGPGADSTVTVADVRPVIWCKQMMEAYTGKLAICNELGQYNSAPGITTAYVDTLVKAGMQIVMLYSGDGTGTGNNARAFHNSNDNSLRASGAQVAAYVSAVNAADTSKKRAFAIKDGAYVYNLINPDSTGQHRLNFDINTGKVVDGGYPSGGGIGGGNYYLPYNADLNSFLAGDSSLHNFSEINISTFYNNIGYITHNDLQVDDNPYLTYDNSSGSFNFNLDPNSFIQNQNAVTQTGNFDIDGTAAVGKLQFNTVPAIGANTDYLLVWTSGGEAKMVNPNNYIFNQGPQNNGVAGMSLPAANTINVVLNKLKADSSSYNYMYASYIGGVTGSFSGNLTAQGTVQGRDAVFGGVVNSSANIGLVRATSYVNSTVTSGDIYASIKGMSVLPSSGTQTGAYSVGVWGYSTTFDNGSNTGGIMVGVRGEANFHDNTVQAIYGVEGKAGIGYDCCGLHPENNVPIGAALHAMAPAISGAFPHYFTEYSGLKIEALSSSVMVSAAQPYAIYTVGSTGIVRFENGRFQLPNLPTYASNTAALTAGLLAGDVYWNGDDLKRVH